MSVARSAPRGCRCRDPTWPHVSVPPACGRQTDIRRPQCERGRSVRLVAENGYPTPRQSGSQTWTALAYEGLLTNLLIIEAMPAWTSNRLKRLVLSPKRYVADPALVGAILRLDANAIMRSGDLLGRLLDTFVASQLRAELAVSTSRPRLYHVRQQQGRFEVDVVANSGEAV